MSKRTKKTKHCIKVSGQYIQLIEPGKFSRGSDGVTKKPRPTRRD